MLNKNNIISTTQKYKNFQYIRKKGSNFKKGDLLIKKNTVINARALGLIISSKTTHIKVLKMPKIAVLASGNELRKAGSTFNNWIISSNTTLLKSIIYSFGGDPVDLGIAKDNPLSITRKLKDINKYNQTLHLD